jgi:plasmid stabilization system protein ParE
MVYEVKIAEAAYQDLDDFLDYMVSKLRNKQAALRFHEELFKRIAPLSTSRHQSLSRAFSMDLENTKV